MNSVVFVIFIALLSLAPGQTRAAALTGVVRDTAGGPIPGATITAIRGSEQRKAFTNSSGRYRFDDLPPGAYRLEASLQGFRKAVDDGVVIGVSGGVERDFVLSLGIMTHADYVVPAGGFPGALRTANAVLHVRVERVVGPGLLGPARALLATEHRALVLSVVKDDTGRIRQGETITFWQVQAGEWIEDGRRFVGESRPYTAADEFVGLFKRDPDGKFVELSGGYFMFPVVDGMVNWQREPVAGVEPRMPVDAFVKALAAIVGKTPLDQSARGGQVWFWFATCGGPLMTLEVRLDNRVVHKSTFPLCHASRETTDRQGQDGRIEFSWRPGRAIVWEGYRDSPDRTAANDMLEVNIWEAGADPDALLLGVTAVTGRKIVMNTIHIARATAPDESPIAKGLTVRTYPATR